MHPSDATLFAVLGLAVVTVGGAMARDSTSDAGAPRPRPTREAPSCPLSLTQQKKAIDAFAKMLPVIRHPRCTNCHGGVDPFAADDAGNHGGGQMDKDAGIEQCQSCHDQLPKWDIPGSPMFFAGRSDEAICTQMKRFESTGTDFIEHMRNDKGGVQFLAAAFKGERALGKEFQDSSASGQPFTAQPPPGTQDELTAKAKEWVAAMGGEFVGSPECGCVRGKIELKMTSGWTGTADGNSMHAEATATVPLTADTSGLVFTGAAALVHGQYSVTTPPECSVELKPAGGVLQVKEARFTGESDMAIALDVLPTTSGGTMIWHCPRMAAIALPLIPWSGQWSYMHQQEAAADHFHFDEFDVPPVTDFGNERTLIGSKEVVRERTLNEMIVVSKTTFEFWWLGLAPTPE